MSDDTITIPVKRWRAALLLVVAVIGAGVALRPVAVEALDVETRASHAADVDTLRAEHDADIRDIQRMLGCALWHVPEGCADALKAELLSGGT